MRHPGFTGPALLGLLALGACGRTTTAPSPPAPRSPAPTGASSTVSPTPIASSRSSTPTSPPLPSRSPTSTPAPGSSIAPVTGLQGTVSAGPTCPVQRVDSPCPPALLATEVDAVNAAGQTAATARSGSDGHYRVTLVPGSYTLRVVGASSFPRCPTPAATVTAGTVTTVDISCDTGIR